MVRSNGRRLHEVWDMTRRLEIYIIGKNHRGTHVIIRFIMLPTITIVSQ